MQMNNIIQSVSSYPSFPYLLTDMNLSEPSGRHQRQQARGDRQQAVNQYVIIPPLTPDAYSFIPVDFSLYSLGVMPVWLLKIELKVVFELNPAS